MNVKYILYFLAATTFDQTIDFTIYYYGAITSTSFDMSIYVGQTANYVVFRYIGIDSNIPIDI